MKLRIFVSVRVVGEREWDGPDLLKTTVTVAEPSTLLRLDHSGLNALRASHPRLGGHLVQALSLDLAERLRFYEEGNVFDLLFTANAPIAYHFQYLIALQLAHDLRNCAQTPAGGRKSERFAFAEDHQQTVGQKLYTLTRDALGQLVQLVQGLFAQGQSYQQVLERLMPA